MKIGIIGLGDMGKLYATTLAGKGYRVFGCDIPEKKKTLEKELEGTDVHLLNDGIAVSRLCDMIIYSVETENIETAVAKYGKHTRRRAIVAGQTSVKAPEIAAFERYLPGETNIVTCHSMHRPSLTPEGQNMVVISHRSTMPAFAEALEVFKSIGSNIIQLPSYQSHDMMTADTQAVTHLALESLGASWQGMKILPWEDGSPQHMIDNLAMSSTLALYGGKSHVFSGLAMYNPYAMQQMRSYQRSASELFDLMVMGRESKLRKRIAEAGEFVFSDEMRASEHMLLSAGTGQCGFLRNDQGGNPTRPIASKSHLYLLAMVDSWKNLGLNPYDNLACNTPQYQVRLGSTEHLFRHHALLEDSIQCSLNNPEVNKNDRYFCVSVKNWTDLVNRKDIECYRQKFDGIKEHLGLGGEGMQKAV